MKILDRKGAKATGAARYFTGKPCKRGHVAERYFPGGKCVVCATDGATKWAEENPDKSAAVKKSWQERNKGKHLEACRRHYAKNAHRHAALVRDWNSRNAHAVNARNGKVRAAKRNATPEWADHGAIKKIYFKARAEGMEVDHIVPLVGPMVQGLDMWSPIKRCDFFGPLIPVVQGFHVEHNMRLLSKPQNVRKSNRVWPDMPTVQLN